jgi:hypothetical protein
MVQRREMPDRELRETQDELAKLEGESWKRYGLVI